MHTVTIVSNYFSMVKKCVYFLLFLYVLSQFHTSTWRIILYYIPCFYLKNQQSNQKNHRYGGISQIPRKLSSDFHWLLQNHTHLHLSHLPPISPFSSFPYPISPLHITLPTISTLSNFHLFSYPNS